MDWGLIASVVLGVGVAGHAVVGVVLTTRLSQWTERLWSIFGTHNLLLRLNGLLLAIASGLHFVVSLAKVWGAAGAPFWSAIAPFPFFFIAGLLERRPVTGLHHAMMALGFAAFAWHGTI